MCTYILLVYTSDRDSWIDFMMIEALVGTFLPLRHGSLAAFNCELIK